MILGSEREVSTQVTLRAGSGVVYSMNVFTILTFL